MQNITFSPPDITEEEIAEAYKLLASTEGVLAEPASSASVAGLIKAHKIFHLKY